MEILFGVNGGGTSCRVALATKDGQIISRSTGGAANIETSMEEAKENIIITCKEALKNASLPENMIFSAAAVLGLAGSNMGNFHKKLTQQLPFKENTIVNDGRITLEGALGDKDGCIASLGTGSVYFGRINGIVKQVGGWGFLLGDDGSGAKIGLELLKASIKCAEKLDSHSELTMSVCSSYENKIVNIVNGVRSFKPKDFAKLAPKVFEAYKNSDPVAVKIINRELAVVEKTIYACGFRADLPFCLLGGLSPFYRPILAKTLSINIQEPEGDAVDGALSLAIKKYS